MQILSRFSSALLLIGALALLFGPLQCACQADSAPSQSTSAATATPAASPAQQAYSLSSEKLSKAISLNRIRHSLAIGGSLWSLLVLWLLLACRSITKLAAWSETIGKRRWVL